MYIHLSVLLSTWNIGSQWMDYYDLWYLRIFQKSVKEIQVLLESNKNIGYFTRGPVYIYGNFLLNSS